MAIPNWNAIISCIGANPKQLRWSDYPDWGKELLKFHAPNTQLYIGAYEGQNLVGCMIGHPDILLIQNQLFKAAIIAITEVFPSHRNRGIASGMLQKMLAQIISLEFDLALAFHTAGRGGKTILKTAGFYKIHKYGHAGKVLDKNRMDTLMDLNPILRKIALKIVSEKIGAVEPQRGTIREAKESDLDQVVALLNQESNRLDIGSYWTKAYLKKKMNWRYKVLVLEDSDHILGAVITYTETATLGKDYFTTGFLKELVFHDDIDDNDKKALVNYVLVRFKDLGIPSVSYPYPKNIWKIIKKLGFHVLPGDERTVFVKPLSFPATATLSAIQKFRYVNLFLIC
ncbi:MAG: GNAT family N-acetyltransferase [Candidatus Helarchaeota archaeon]